jgi:hypothetical protein
LAPTVEKNRARGEEDGSARVFLVRHWREDAVPDCLDLGVHTLKKLSAIAGVFLGCAMCASAHIKWTLSDVHFDNGNIANGYFVIIPLTTKFPIRSMLQVRMGRSTSHGADDSEIIWEVPKPTLEKVQADQRLESAAGKCAIQIEEGASLRTSFGLEPHYAFE